MKISILFIFILIFTQASGAFSKSNSTKNISKDLTKKDNLLKEVLSRYRSEESVEVKLEKNIFMALLKKTKKSSGYLKMSKGRVRIKFLKPDPILIIFDKKDLWIERKDKDFDTKQVIKINNKKAHSQSAGLLFALLDKNQFFKNFKILKFEKRKNNIIYNLGPKNILSKISRVYITVNEKRKTIDKVLYFDKIKNEITYYFSKTIFGKKFPKKTFVYKISKDTELIEIK